MRTQFLHVSLECIKSAIAETSCDAPSSRQNVVVKTVHGSSFSRS
jgi:hypothetical protein